MTIYYVHAYTFQRALLEKLKLNEFPAGTDSRAMSEAARELGQLASYPKLKLCAHVIPYSKVLSSVWKSVLLRMLASQTASGLSLFLVLLFSSH